MLVGPISRVRGLLTEPDHPRLSYVEAPRRVPMDGDALRIVREFEDVSVRVAAELVAAGRADACVSAGHSGAAVAASVFAMGRMSSISRPPLAVVLPSLAGPVVLLDVGAGTTASVQLLGQFALVGAAYARALGVAEPRVGLLTIGAEPGKGDELRREADLHFRERLTAANVTYAGCVEGFDVALGGRADVIVTDGFTGNVLLKGVEGTVAWAAANMGDPEHLAQRVAASDFAGGVLLGINGISVIGHGAATPAAIAACVRLADRVWQGGLVARAAELMSP